jgi:transcriptional regulator GlxA family with amidase domain
MGEMLCVASLGRKTSKTRPPDVKARGFPELAVALEALRTRISAPPASRNLELFCQLSEPNFSRLVRRALHFTPRQLAMKVRLDEALHLPATTDLSLAEITLATGVSTTKSGAPSLRPASSYSSRSKIVDV